MNFSQIKHKQTNHLKVCELIFPREQQEIIERQNIYDGTWEKAPSMGWMFVPLVEYQGGGVAATIEPLKEHLPHYAQRLANLFGTGLQACYRGPQLCDSPETEALVKKWVTFYKRHRQILDGDIIHLRRPDGRDYDAILHVDPQCEEKGLLMLYNPLDFVSLLFLSAGLCDYQMTSLTSLPLCTFPVTEAGRYSISSDHKMLSAENNFIITLSLVKVALTKTCKSCKRYLAQTGQ